MFYYDDSLQTEVIDTTYSQDIRIENELQREKQIETAEEELIETSRRTLFHEIYKEQTEIIFHLRGLKILKFTNKKVKFMFEPSKVVNFVSAKVIFYCSLKYLNNYGMWIVKKDSFPANFKWKIYSLFYGNGYFAVDDESLILTIQKIHRRLELWSQKEEKYRLKKNRRFLSGEELFLDSDDEELFLSDHQREELNKNRDAILKRMLPPQRRGRRRQRVLESRRSSSSDFFTLTKD